VRRLFVVNILILAVLASAVGLGYYVYSFASEVSSREAEALEDTLRELAGEKVVGIETQIIGPDEEVFAKIRFDPLSNLGVVLKEARALVRSIFVLDDKLQLVPSGYFGQPASSRDAAGGEKFREVFLRDIVPTLGLERLRDGERGHLHTEQYLFLFKRITRDDKTYFVILEEDSVAWLTQVFDQYFPTRGPRLYQIVDDAGRTVYGVPSLPDGTVVVSHRFTETFDRWTVRVAQKDIGVGDARRSRRLIDFVLIGISLVVILASLGALAYAIRRERRANELKSEFISNVSHELKTPLSIISMFGEMLALGRTKNPAQATEYAEIIWRESVRLARLIDNVLDFAKIERGVDVYEFTDDVDVAEVVQRALELSVHRLQKAEMIVDTKLAPDLPRVRLDANAYTLAVLNLVDNAIKYASGGKQIDVELARAGDRVVLRVRDRGPGIPEDEHDRIFERFYRGREVRLKPIRGSGIGLALVQHIAQAHDGDISVTSTPGSGSTFELWIPISGT
jgi:two-component system phosphate regulon sensor histidine kinase PhoR